MKQLIVAFILVLCACNPAKKLQKAEQLVITNPQSFEKLGLKWAELNPCANDTVISLVEAAVDSITFAEYLKYLDKKNEPSKVDSIPLLLRQAYYFGFDEAKKQYGLIKIPKTEKKTVIQTVLDVRGLNKLKDSIDKLNVNNALITGQIGQLNIELSKQVKSTNKWVYWLIGVSMLFLVSLYVNIRKYLI
jgi:hypothetical protein